MRTNYISKRAALKIVYYGAGLSGKTVNLETVFSSLQPHHKLSSEVIKHTETTGDRTLFFDFLPVDLGIEQKIGNYTVELHLFTVPGQSHYELTRKKILEEADGVVFVADSQKELRESNLIAMREMIAHLGENKINFETIPMVLQFNKRDLENVMPSELMFHELKRDDKQKAFNAIAIENKGVGETLREIAKQTITSKLKKA